MGKLCLISDTHFAIKKASKTFADSQKRYFYTELIPMLQERKITELVILGDLYDNRTSIDAKILNDVFHLFETLKEKCINVTILIGNHDTQYKTNIDTHSLKYLSLYPNVHVIEDITVKRFYDLDVTLFPWQVDDVFTQKAYETDIAFGHFDISGCKLNKTTVQEGGTGQSFFWRNFKKTFSGHFHTQSHYDGPKGQTIDYIGSPYQLTRNDIGEEKGCIILDTTTLEIERVNNKTALRYIKVQYPTPKEELPLFNNIIDVHVNITDSFNSDKLNKYVASLHEGDDLGEPIDVKVIPHYHINSVDDTEQDLSKIKSVSEMISSKVNTLDLDDTMKQYTLDYIMGVYDSINALA
jgi:DNA repair exonuclease SbcCD nuclease subunit